MNHRRRSAHVPMRSSPSQDGNQVNHVWSQEESVNPLAFLFSEEEKYAGILCPRCNGYLKTSPIDQLPKPWKELPRDGDDASCFYNEATNQVVYEPPVGCTEAACRVFYANGSVFARCSCRIPWERRRYVLRKIRIYATNYKDHVHHTLARELAKIMEKDGSCNLE